MRMTFVSALILALLGPARVSAGQEPGRAPHGWMHAVLERTFLRIDVAALDLCIDSAAALRVSSFVATPSRETDDSIARAVFEAREVLGRLRFLRNVSYGQFLGGIADEQSKAVRAGLLADSTHVAVRARLPEWFSFLENRNVHEGDEIVYHIQGDTVRTVYADSNGTQLMERRDTGAARRMSVLATWLAPGSGFRNPLLQTARRAGDPGDACRPVGAGPAPGRAVPVRPRAVRPSPLSSIP